LTETTPRANLFVVMPDPAGEPLLAAVERALAGEPTALAALPALTAIAAGDPYLAQQLVALHQSWEIRPLPSRGLLARLRTRLAWWLLGPEIQQANAVHATLVRLIDSLLAQLDQDRAARRRIEEQLAYRNAE
jgi:hypothetical protein